MCEEGGVRLEGRIVMNSTTSIQEWDRIYVHSDSMFESLADSVWHFIQSAFLANRWNLYVICRAPFECKQHTKFIFSCGLSASPTHKHPSWSCAKPDSYRIPSAFTPLCVEQRMYWRFKPTQSTLIATEDGRISTSTSPDLSPFVAVGSFWKITNS